MVYQQKAWLGTKNLESRKSGIYKIDAGFSI